LDDGDGRNFFDFLQMGISWELVYPFGYPSCFGDRGNDKAQSSKFKVQRRIQFILLPSMREGLPCGVVEHTPQGKGETGGET
jgi:hypothetical protein